MARVTAKQAPATAYDICATRFILMRHFRIQFVPNASGAPLTTLLAILELMYSASELQSQLKRDKDQSVAKEAGQAIPFENIHSQ